MVKVAVLVSGGGTNLQALLDAGAKGELGSGSIRTVISSSDKAYALTRAKNSGVETVVLRPKDFPTGEAFGEALCGALEARGIGLVALAGYMTILPKEVIARYRDRILNVHPSLIPAFSGPGYYGLRVHQEALDHGVKVTGATVHLVSEVVDGGRILLQRAVDVLEGDTPESLQRRVMENAEWLLLPQAVRMLCDEIENQEVEAR